MADRIAYVGLGVHKESVAVVVAEGGLRGKVREYGRIANTPVALDRLAQARRRRGEATVSASIITQTGSGVAGRCAEFAARAQK